MERPELTEEELNSLVEHKPLSVINKYKARARGTKLKIRTQGGLFKVIRSLVAGTRNRVFAERCRLELTDSTIVCTDKSEVYGSGNEVWAEDSTIFGANHKKIRGTNLKIYANDCMDVEVDNSEFYGVGCSAVGGGNRDLSGKNVLKDPPPPPPEPIPAGEIDWAIIEAVGNAVMNRPVAQRKVHICPEDPNEKDVGDDEDLPDEELCMMCYARRRTTKFVPCCHVVYCSKCAQTLNDQSEQVNQKCPSCKDAFVAVIMREKEYLT